MKIQRIIPKIFSKVNNPLSAVKKQVTEPMLYYDTKYPTAEEYRNYVHYLAKNNINKTFREPERLYTEEERKILQQKDEELNKYREFVHNLAVNNINRTFYC